MTWRVEAIPRHAMPCHAMPCHAMPCHAMSSMQPLAGSTHFGFAPCGSTCDAPTTVSLSKPWSWSLLASSRRRPRPASAGAAAAGRSTSSTATSCGSSGRPRPGQGVGGGHCRAFPVPFGAPCSRTLAAARARPHGGFQSWRRGGGTKGVRIICHL